MYLNKYESRKCENFTDTGMGYGVFNVGVVEWHHGFDGTQSTSLAVSETLKVMKYDCKTNFS